MVKKGLRVLSFSVFLILGACATWSSSYEVIRGVDVPRAELVRLIDRSLPLGRRAVQDQGRVSLSNYFVIGPGGLTSADDLPERFYAEITIVGDRRPYLLDIRVHREVRDPGRSGFGHSEYVRKGSNRELAQLVKRRVQRSLSQRRGDFNLIDDFRAF